MLDNFSNLHKIFIYLLTHMLLFEFSMFPGKVLVLKIDLQGGGLEGNRTSKK